MMKVNYLHRRSEENPSLLMFTSGLAVGGGGVGRGGLGTDSYASELDNENPPGQMCPLKDLLRLSVMSP